MVYVGWRGRFSMACTWAVREFTLTTAILIGGVVLAVLAAAIMTRPTYRLPALMVALFAIPGNVDNLMPQMRLDPHTLANNVAPAISVVDLLIAWALLLTIRERQIRWGTEYPRAGLVLGIALAVLSGISAAVAAANGVELAAATRGLLTIARIPAMILLALALRPHLRDGRLIVAACAIGAIALLGNGLYTSVSGDLGRFTASTFGRNGFALALVLTAVCAGGSALVLHQRGDRGRWWTLGATLTAVACIYGTLATGTRMAILALIPALGAGLLISRFWLMRRNIRAVAVAVTLLVVTMAGANLTAEGGRALSALLDPGGTVDIVTNPDDEPEWSPVRSRSEFWAHAAAMAVENPIVGVGPYQWNFVRYERDPDEVQVVADPHNTYLQLAAEYGFAAMALYLALIAVVAIGILDAAWRNRQALSFATVALVICAALYPVTELTNSHLFNVRLGAAGWLLIASALVVMRDLPGRHGEVETWTPSAGEK